VKEPEVSVVIPARNEAENLVELLPEIGRALAGRDFEIVVVDDGSTDDTAAVVEQAGADSGLPVRLGRHARPLGKSAAIWTAVETAAAEIIVTFDGDGQDDPAFIGELMAPLADPAVGLVAGRRINRSDSAAKRLGSRIANGIRRWLLSDDTPDTGCGAKAYRRSAFLRLPYFDTQHRFMSALFLADGWRIAHVDVVNRPRRHGRSHYGILDRLAVGIPDLYGVWWLKRRRANSPFNKENRPK